MYCKDASPGKNNALTLSLTIGMTYGSSEAAIERTTFKIGHFHPKLLTQLTRFTAIVRQ